MEIQKGNCMRITIIIVISRGPFHSRSLNRPTPALAAARHWHFVDNQLPPLLSGAMFGLHSSLLRFSHQRFTSTFPLVSKLKAFRLNWGTVARYYTACSNMSDLFVELTAPNGRKYKQPRGLFINNEFVKSKSGETITSINPRYALFEC